MEIAVAVGGLSQLEVELDDVPIVLDHSFGVPGSEIEVSAWNLAIVAVGVEITGVTYRGSRDGDDSYAGFEDRPYKFALVDLVVSVDLDGDRHVDAAGRVHHPETEFYGHCGCDCGAETWTNYLGWLFVVYCARVDLAVHWRNVALEQIEDQGVVDLVTHTEIGREQWGSIEGNCGYLNDKLFIGGDVDWGSEGDNHKVILFRNGDSAIELKRGPIGTINLNVLGLSLIIGTTAAVLDFNFGLVDSYAGREGDTLSAWTMRSSNREL